MSAGAAVMRVFTVPQAFRLSFIYLFISFTFNLLTSRHHLKPSASGSLSRSSLALISPAMLHPPTEVAVGDTHITGPTRLVNEG